MCGARGLSRITTMGVITSSASQRQDPGIITRHEEREASQRSGQEEGGRGGTVWMGGRVRDENCLVAVTSRQTNEGASERISTNLHFGVTRASSCDDSVAGRSE